MNIALIIFAVVFALIITERFNKAILALAGATLMVLFGVLNFEEAVAAIDFETIILLMSMMVVVEIARKSELFSLINIKIANKAKGNPLFLYVFFLGITALFSAFLDNVTTVLIVVPITIGLLQEMQIKPQFFIVSEILMSNIGGALTLIGDPPNILIGSAAKLSFNAFIVNLWIPIVAIVAAIMAYTILRNWQMLKPISKDLKKLFLSAVLIQKLNLAFQKKQIVPSFLWGAVALLLLTIVGFFLQSVLQLTPAVIALMGALAMLIFLRKHVHFHQKLAAVEWTTLMFFSGLFVMVRGIEETGILERIGEFISHFSGNYFVLLMMVVWISGLVSMIFDNIPFVTVMIPVIFHIQKSLDPDLDPQLLWWALSLGACLGGNGTAIGASANVVAIGIAESNKIPIKFFDYFKIAFPLTILMLGIVSLHFYFRV